MRLSTSLVFQTYVLFGMLYVVMAASEIVSASHDSTAALAALGQLIGGFVAIPIVGFACVFLIDLAIFVWAERNRMRAGAGPQVVPSEKEDAGK